MSKVAEIHYDGQVYEMPVIEGSENEKAIDISSLRAKSGLITIDQGFKNTGSTTSAITFLDGELGILRYRGYPIRLSLRWRTCLFTESYQKKKPSTVSKKTSRTIH